MNVGSLFSGIGGFDLGLERAGMRTLWFCEQDPYCQRVLARHWPGVPCYPDVRSLVADAERGGLMDSDYVGRSDGATTSARRPERIAEDDERLPSEGRGAGSLPVQVPQVDVLAGGFPCQDLSVAGKGAGIDGARSGLWSEFARLIGELRPRYVLVENVPALLARGMGRVLGDLAALGYDAEWDCLPASAFGAPHRRDRVWIVAYPEQSGLEGSTGPRVSGAGRPRFVAAGSGQGLQEREVRSGWDRAIDTSGWEVEPALGRVADGFPGRVDQLRALGNALVPQIAQWLGERVMAYEAQAAHRQNPVRW